MGSYTSEKEVTGISIISGLKNKMKLRSSREKCRTDLRNRMFLQASLLLKLDFSTAHSQLNPCDQSPERQEQRTM